MQTTRDKKREGKLSKGGHPRFTNWKNPVAVIRMRICACANRLQRHRLNPIVQNLSCCVFTSRGRDRPHAGPVLYVTSRQIPGWEWLFMTASESIPA